MDLSIRFEFSRQKMAKIQIILGFKKTNYSFDFSRLKYFLAICLKYNFLGENSNSNQL